jgi:hypothetical protein
MLDLEAERTDTRPALFRVSAAPYCLRVAAWVLCGGLFAACGSEKKQEFATTSPVENPAPSAAAGSDGTGSRATSSGTSTSGREGPPLDAGKVPMTSGPQTGAGFGLDASLPPECRALDGGVPFAQSCAECAGGDACGVCLCGTCADEIEVCAQTPGCPEIVACARSSGCTGVDCFCGTVDLLTCATTSQANGPCTTVTRNAPGYRQPTLLSPSAGPASDAAQVLAECSSRSTACTAACSN